ncbi:MAG: hypothetical protein AB7R55_14880 [Gemmatimonadales bacterium]
MRLLDGAAAAWQGMQRQRLADNGEALVGLEELDRQIRRVVQATRARQRRDLDRVISSGR